MPRKYRQVGTYKDRPNTFLPNIAKSLKKKKNYIIKINNKII